jgi:glycerol-3-phosphate dehydrogenase
MNRDESLDRIVSREEPWDIAVVGGGATGTGIALDAAARGYAVCLFERGDFGKGTSSRSTKIVHGGVRYLAEGDISLVMEGLKERGIMRRIAPHMVHDLEFIVPCYSWWDLLFYGAGLTLYNLLALWYGFGASRILSRAETLRRLPTLQAKGLRGGVLYHDGQFDDTRMLATLAETATEQGAALMNYAPVTGVLHDEHGAADGISFTDLESGETHEIKAKCVVNATGPFSDTLRQQEDAAAKPIIVPSQGVHLFFDRSFMPLEDSIMVPKTPDGRVLFAIPWNNRTLIGTTDTPMTEVPLEPRALDKEIDFILETAAPYFATPPRREDIRAVLAGIRPLVGDLSENTARVSRDYTVRVEPSRVLTVAGGKWTIYRKMAESAVDKAIEIAGLAPRPSPTTTLELHGYAVAEDAAFPWYGSDSHALEELMREEPALAERLHERLPLLGVHIVWAARHEMARTVEDVLVRRTRSLLEDADAAIEVAPKVAALLAKELGRDATWQAEQIRAFTDIAQNYLP